MSTILIFLEILLLGMTFKIAILKIWWVKISSIKLWKEEKKPIKLVSPKELVPIWTKTSTTMYLFKSIFQLYVNSNFMSQYFSWLIPARCWIENQGQSSGFSQWWQCFVTKSLLKKKKTQQVDNIFQWIVFLKIMTSWWEGDITWIHDNLLS